MEIGVPHYFGISEAERLFAVQNPASRKADSTLASSPSVVHVARILDIETLFLHLIVAALAFAQLLLL
jgi:hypothetical protein